MLAYHLFLPFDSGLLHFFCNFGIPLFFLGLGFIRIFFVGAAWAEAGIGIEECMELFLAVKFGLESFLRRVEPLNGRKQILNLKGSIGWLAIVSMNH